MRVIVISGDGWSWLLALLQFGFTEVICVSTSEEAQRQLKRLRDFVQTNVAVLEVGEDDDLFTTPASDKKFVLCTHLPNPSSSCLASLWRLRDRSGGRCIISFGGAHNQHNHLRDECGQGFTWQLLRHTKLGGLTTARIWVGWSGFEMTISPGDREYPKRPLHRFLEQASKAPTRRATTEGCWFPFASEPHPFPWPWRRAPRWVETTSVFFPGKMVQRRLSAKERCQLMDIVVLWTDVVDEIWEWNEGATPPIRCLIEFLVSIPNRHRTDEGIAREGAQSKIEAVPDWGRIRAPWLGLQGHARTGMEQYLYFGWRWSPADMEHIAVACKKDDAEVDLSLWAVGGDTPGHEEARGVLRNFLWQCWCRSIRREANRWLEQTTATGEEIQRDRQAIQDCLRRCAGSTWWNWDSGSRLFFWRWPPAWREEARDGAKGFHHQIPRPRLHFPQVPLSDPWIVQKDKEKLEKLLWRGYIGPGHCRTTVPRFPVPKGTDDIRVVWDLSKNGVNRTMYTPTFFLASMSSYLRRIEAGYYGGDFDVGEQFHNYMLHESEQLYCGVELPKDLQERLTREGLSVQRFMRWTRLVFGWQSSPYQALRMFARALEWAKGPPSAPWSYFKWSSVILNLPGTSGYDPGRPRVMKVTTEGQPTSDCVTFYDDGRVFGPTQEQAQGALRQITSRIQYLGNQEAARKRREVSQRPGAWAGGVAYTDQNLLRTFVSQAKWDKTRVFLDWVWDALCEPEPRLDRRVFCSGKGFLVHVSLCYEFMQPYMKGFHLSEHNWRADRDKDGWKLRRALLEDALDVEDEMELPPLDEIDPELDIPEDWGFRTLGPEHTPTEVPGKLVKPAPADQPPNYITPVTRLREDVRILKLFFEAPTPLHVIARPVEGTQLVVYGGGDASGEGFGGQLLPLTGIPLLRRGFWLAGESDESSNWRELRNLIDTITDEARLGKLAGKEVWLATDNTTAALAYHKGTSTSKVLHDMVTELRMTTLAGNFMLHLYHIAGTRMIASGIDGLSRGELHLSALEDAVSTIMPLHLSPLQRSPSLQTWLSAWLGVDFQIAQPNDWFHSAQQAAAYSVDSVSESWVWDLPPAAALHALEELGGGRLKRHYLLRGVVLIPHLLTHEWFRRFSRIVDVYFQIPAGGIPEWPCEMHEPLTIGIFLPLFRYQPWDWKQVPFMVPYGSAMSSLYRAGDPSAGSHLREFWRASAWIATMPEGMVRNLLQNPSWRRFLHLSAQGR